MLFSAVPEGEAGHRVYRLARAETQQTHGRFLSITRALRVPPKPVHPFAVHQFIDDTTFFSANDHRINSGHTGNFSQIRTLLRYL